MDQSCLAKSKKKQNVERAAIFIALWVFAFWLTVRRVALLAIVQAGEKVIDILCLGPLKCIPCKHALTQSYKHNICVFTYIHMYVYVHTLQINTYIYFVNVLHRILPPNMPKPVWQSRKVSATVDQIRPYLLSGYDLKTNSIKWFPTVRCCCHCCWLMLLLLLWISWWVSCFSQWVSKSAWECANVAISLLFFRGKLFITVYFKRKRKEKIWVGTRY